MRDGVMMTVSNYSDFGIFPTSIEEMADPQSVVDRLNEVTETMHFSLEVEWIDIDPPEGLTESVDPEVTIEVTSFKQMEVYIQYEGFSNEHFRGGTVSGRVKWELLAVHQNNRHHLEGWNYNHLIMMYLVLKDIKLDAFNRALLERAIFWHDLGKRPTQAVGNKCWEGCPQCGTKDPCDGLPMSSFHNHAQRIAEEMQTNIDWQGLQDFRGVQSVKFMREVVYLVNEHMEAHSVHFEGKGSTDIPEPLLRELRKLSGKDSVQDSTLTIPPGEWTPLNGALWPAWEKGQEAEDVFPGLSHEEKTGINRKKYVWWRRWNTPRLHILQQCDSQGRIAQDVQGF